MSNICKDRQKGDNIGTIEEYKKTSTEETQENWLV